MSIKNRNNQQLYMGSSRRRNIAKKAGLISIKDRSKTDLISEESTRSKKEDIEKSTIFYVMKTTKKLFDDYYLDGIIGLIPVGIGDLIASIAVIPFLYFSLFKVKSVPLFIAILYNMMKDAIIGLTPFYVGNVCDFFINQIAKILICVSVL